MSCPETVFEAALAILLSLAAYAISKKLAVRKIGRFSLNAIPPLVTAAFMVSLAVRLGPFEFDDYTLGGDMILMLLGPATVALALPLYEYRDLIRENFAEVCVALFVSVGVSGAGSFLMAYLAGLDESVAISAAPKCVTTPVAIEIVKMSDRGIIPLTVFCVFVAGMSGAFFGHGFLKLLGIKDDVSKGLAMGASSHVIGTARCLEVSARQAAFSALILALVAIFSTVAAAFIL